MKKATILTVLLLSLSFGVALAQTTTVWIVRHAEKDVSDPQNTDPSLSAIGQQRAKDLGVYLAASKPDVIFSTPYKRTLQTSSAFETQMKLYDPKALKKFADDASQNFKGKTILVIGHSNTVLETVEAFGGKRPVDALTDEDYDYIFKLTIADGKITTETFHYGAKHSDAKGGKMN